MSKEINAIIDNLCEKLGTSAKFLIPELARLRIAEAVVMLVIFSFVLIVGLVTLPRAWRYDHREDAGFLEDSAWTILPAFLIFAGFIGVTAQAVSLAGWIASPTAKAILEIASMLK